MGRRWFRVTLLALMVLVVLDAIYTSLDPWEAFAGQGNDDIMRLMSVRSLLAGQDWFDMTQYRVLPPDGLSLHWSRYVDAGIAAVILPLSWVAPMPLAEVLGAAIWPTLIMMINLSVIGFGTRRLFGNSAACLALLCTALWPVTGDLHAGAGNLDHHNVQMLMMTLMGLAAVWPDRPWRAGLTAGVAAAFSLAVGLETLPFVVAVGAVILLRALIMGDAISRAVLVAFSLALGISAVMFWMGQTAPQLWGRQVCDQLGLPSITLIWIAALACLVPLAVPALRAAPLRQFLATAGLSVAGLALAWPYLAPCLEGPYGNLPPDLQVFITARISEARPALAYMQLRPNAAMQLTLPIFLAVALALWFCWQGRKGGETPTRLMALLGLSGLCVLGIAMLFYQVRATIMAASVAPVLIGYILAQVLTAYRTRRNAAVGLGGLVLAMAMISPSSISVLAAPLLPQDAEGALVSAGDCRSYASLSALNAAPKGRVLNHFNFGPSVLWATHHDVLSVGYHRSADGMINSVVPYQLAEAALAAHLQEAGATYLLLCRDYDYDSAFVTGLAAGDSVAWLRPVPLNDPHQVLLEVLPQ